jgi:aspartate dehydrogenase
MADGTGDKARVAVAGFGAVGREVAKALAAGLPGLALAAVSARDRAKAAEGLKSLGLDVPILPVEELAEIADIVVECAPAEILPQIATPVLERGGTVVVISVGALLEHEHLIRLAEARGGRIIVPTGALIGLDAVSAAAEGEIRSIRMVTRKPVRGLVGAPFLAEKGIDITEISEPLRIFEGTAREAAKGFPANLNVAVALALAGIGPDRTRLEIWADPGIDRNTHEIHVDADSARFMMRIENIPSENPKTGRITAKSVVAALRKLRAPLRVGT